MRAASCPLLGLRRRRGRSAGARRRRLQSAGSRCCSTGTTAGTSRAEPSAARRRSRSTCGTRGAVPVPDAVPVGRRSDRSRPVSDRRHRRRRRRAGSRPASWPDQPDRFHRLHAALGIAQADPPTVRAGDAVDDLAATIDQVAERRPPRRDQLVGPELPRPRRSDARTSPSSTGSVRLRPVVDLRRDAGAGARRAGSGRSRPSAADRRHTRSVGATACARSSTRPTRHPHGYWIALEPHRAV